jgi:alcohol dehydrogenase class IV
MSSFVTAGKILFARGAIGSLPRELPAGEGRVMLVCGKSFAARSGLVQRLGRDLGSLEVFSGVEPDPSLETLARARGILRDGAFRAVVAVGGGSAIDLGKAAAGLAREEGDGREYMDGRPIEREGVWFAAVPTTAGSGAEVTPNSVLTDTTRRVKRSIRAESFLPGLALLDPELTLTLPPDVTAACGADALVQAVEAFTSIHATPLTDALSEKAVLLLSANLVQVVRAPGDIDAREGMLMGSLLAGMAFANARLGAVHGIAHPLGALYGVPHGVACAVLAPAVTERNHAFAAEKYARVAAALGSALGMEGRRSADAAPLLGEIFRRAGLPADLSPFRVRREDHARIVPESLASGSLKANPKAFTADDVTAVLDRVCR